MRKGQFKIRKKSKKKKIRNSGFWAEDFKFFMDEAFPEKLYLLKISIKTVNMQEKYFLTYKADIYNEALQTNLRQPLEIIIVLFYKHTIKKPA